MKKITFLFFLSYTLLCKAFSGGGTLTAIQMAASDIKKVREYYNSHPQLSVKTYYMAFDDHTSSVIKEGKYGMYEKNASAYYTKILHVETLNLPDMIINVDHHEKLIAIGDNSSLLTDPLNNSLDSLLLFCTDVAYTRVNENERKYTLDFSENDFSEHDKIELTIDIKNNRFTRIALYFREPMNLSGNYDGAEKPPRMEITYSNYRLKLSNSALVDKNNYISETNGSVQPAAKYKGYRVLDLRKKTRIKGYKK